VQSQTDVPTSVATGAPTSERPPVTSIRPTETASKSDDWLPTTIVGDPTSFSFSAPSVIPTGTSSGSAFPTNLPAVLLPDQQKPQPDGTKLIEIGFLYALNYEHVAKNTVAAAQIFSYLPRALSNAGGFDIDKMQITRLEPLDTLAKYGYWTTIAKFYYPENLLEKLQADILSPNSQVYNYPDSLVRDLTAVINPKIDIYGKFTDDNNNGGSNGGNNNGNNNDDVLGNGSNNSSSSSRQQAMTAGIAVGAVGLSALYGAAMFIVARRYKRKRQSSSHHRSSSVTGSDRSSEMQYAGNGSPALMGGALLSRDMSSYGGALGGGRESHGSGRSGMGNSARTANISAPVAAENSLGWR
jgi:hypothetical protein